MKPRTLSGGLKVLHALCTRLCPDVPRSASCKQAGCALKLVSGCVAWSQLCDRRVAN